ncbi:MAG: hypothetical protein L0H12_03945 [Nitrosospira sp.]|nr:hypothetical protein [Nitrosospira sp.]
MANHKRKRPKNRRAGCLLCKPYKANGVNRKDGASESARFSDVRRRRVAVQELRDFRPCCAKAHINLRQHELDPGHPTGNRSSRPLPR